MTNEQKAAQGWVRAALLPAQNKNPFCRAAKQNQLFAPDVPLGWGAARFVHNTPGKFNFTFPTDFLPPPGFSVYATVT